MAWLIACACACILAGWFLSDPLIHALVNLIVRDRANSQSGCLPTILEGEENTDDMGEEKDEDPPAHHASTAAGQKAAALHEARIMAGSPKVEAPWTPLGFTAAAATAAARIFSAEGLVRIDGVIGAHASNWCACSVAAMQEAHPGRWRPGRWRHWCA